MVEEFINVYILTLCFFVPFTFTLEDLRGAHYVRR